jgi:diguanylate cyclase (GGDEF)-like protein/PAS domain S-box-containing protein
MAVYIILLSVGIQFIGALLALRLIAYSRARSPWLLLAAGFVLMAVTRLVALRDVRFGQGVPAEGLGEDWALLLFSLFLLAGLARIKPVLEQFQKTKNQLHKSQERYQYISELSSDYAYALELEEDGDYRVEWVTDAFSQKTGFEPEEVTRESWLASIHPDDQAEAHEVEARLLRGERTTQEFRVVTREGSLRWLSNTSLPIVDSEKGRAVRVYGATRDITQRKQVELELRKNEARLAQSERIAGIGSWGRNLETREDWWSANFYKLLELDPDEQPPSFDVFLSKVHPEDRTQLIKQVQRFTRRFHAEQVEFRIITEAGEVRYFRATGRIDLDEQGDPQQLVGLCIDITDQKLSLAIQETNYRIAQAAVGSKNLRDLYGQLHSILQEVMDAQNFYICLYDPEENLLTFPYFADAFEEKPEPYPPGKGLTEHVLRSGRSFFYQMGTPDVQADVGPSGPTSKAWLGVPLVLEGKTIGVVAIQQYVLTGQFGIREREILEIVSSHLAVAVDRKRSEEALRESEERYRNLYKTALVALWRVRISDGKIIRGNEATARLFGFRDVNHLLSDGYLADFYPPTNPELGYRIIQNPEEEYQAELKIHNRCDQELHVSVWAKAFPDADYLEGAVVDITERKKAEEQLRHNAYHDFLTNLVNRTYILEKLEALFHPESLNRQPDFAILFMDLDNFKDVNDSMGHTMGDQLLVQVADRLAKGIGEAAVIARFGGDEFVVLVEDVKAEAESLQLAEQIHKSFEAPFTLKGQEVYTSVSIGIAVYRENYQHPEEMLRDADIAMYQAKRTGPASHMVYDSPMHTALMKRLRLEAGLRQALERSELQLFYQPIISLDSGKIIGFEALLRWFHPEWGLVMPGDFIRIAEESNQIFAIGSWVVQEACRAAGKWRARFPEDLFVSVNVSGSQFANAGFAVSIREALELSQLPPGLLRLELTESMILEDVSLSMSTFEQLRGIGVEIDLDDFGTGYSSLSYLQNLPLHALKIDQSFILKQDHEFKQDFIRVILALGTSLGVDVIAEGVEDADTLRDLRAMGCRFAQGNYFSPAVEAATVLKLLDKNPTW